MSDVLEVERALVSVYDKTGLEDLATGLHEHGVEIVSTGSTAQRIRDAGIDVTSVEEVTGFPECLDGRVKTLHPAIHAGLLADRSKPSHVEQLEELGIAPFQLVVVNLYPFQDAVASDASDDEIVEMIDIGGPTMLRAAAKNFAHVGIVVSPSNYASVLRHLEEDGGLTAEGRQHLAAAAFAHVAEYDAAISAWFHRDHEFPPR
ncbi:MAG: bifunctional phosphoribosylaminoimidazolecarboxamide formyltransferase/IMP cyclohydrolase, partial [Nitriliruptorales bacterium]|nr:bifunctional phosphoribosylaminoimidazolecarboxamide formyltransferase/IMP cyclohydrolase [Nitriliruptorales bacterium]